MATPMKRKKFPPTMRNRLAVCYTRRRDEDHPLFPHVAAAGLAEGARRRLPFRARPQVASAGRRADAAPAVHPDAHRLLEAPRLPRGMLRGDGGLLRPRGVRAPPRRLHRARPAHAAAHRLVREPLEQGSRPLRRAGTPDGGVHVLRLRRLRRQPLLEPRPRGRVPPHALDERLSLPRLRARRIVPDAPRARRGPARVAAGASQALRRLRRERLRRRGGAGPRRQAAPPRAEEPRGHRGGQRLLALREHDPAALQHPPRLRAGRLPRGEDPLLPHRHAPRAARARDLFGAGPDPPRLHAGRHRHAPARRQGPRVHPREGLRRDHRR